MFTGVTANNTAFADYDDLEDLIEDFCEMSVEQQSNFFTDYTDMIEYDKKLYAICEIADEEEREYALDDFIFDVALAKEDTEDFMDDFNDEFNELEDEANEDETKVGGEIDGRYDKHTDLDDGLEHFCDMTVDEKRQFFEESSKTRTIF